MNEMLFLSSILGPVNTNLIATANGHFFVQ